ncbi:argininosuccinate synthase domain-containing protein [Staphylococcus haemolyticus]|uniref:argininosuccinate synthase domain-containing protein n=1 Tax=Staphylococcus haemolyticus TaxID=1283 RepID=UPI003D9748D4
MKDKIVLAYSGGLDTSVAVKWLIDKGYDVVACCLRRRRRQRFRRCISKSFRYGCSRMSYY